MVKRDVQQLPAEVEPCHTFSLGSRWISEGDCRFDATAYEEGAFAALDAIQRSGLFVSPLSKCVTRIYHPTESQPRSNFKRIWVSETEGVPFLSGKFLLHFRPERAKFLSRLMPKLPELLVPQGTILLSRSGTIGIPVLVGRALSKFAVTDDALRIFPGSIPIGYVYAFLASKYGYTLTTKEAYGSTVSHLEAKHLATIPLPIAEQEDQHQIHNHVMKAYDLRDDAIELLDRAESLLYKVVGVPPFSDSSVEYLGDEGQPRAFSISSSDLGVRFDATHHVPIARSAINRLAAGRHPLVALENVVEQIHLPDRFARIYVDEEHGVPFLQGRQLPLMRIPDLQYISATHTKDISQWSLRHSSVLVTRSGTIGRISLATRLMDGWTASEHILRVHVRTNQLHPGYLAAFLATPYGQHQLKSKIYGGVVDELTPEDTARVMLPLPPLALQAEIGELVASAFELRDRANELETDAIRSLEDCIERGAIAKASSESVKPSSR